MGLTATNSNGDAYSELFQEWLKALLPRDNIVIFVCVLYISTVFHGLLSKGLAFQYYNEKATWAAWHLEGVHPKRVIVALKYADIVCAIKKCYMFRALQQTLGLKIFTKEYAVTLIRPVCLALIREPTSSTSFGIYFWHTTTIKYSSCGHEGSFNVIWAQHLSAMLTCAEHLMQNAKPDRKASVACH